MSKFKILKEMPINRTYASDDLPNLDKRGKPVYVNDWGIIVPICPFCSEFAYEKTHCVFCGAEFEELTPEEIKAKKEANHEYTVVYKNIKVHQVCESVWLFKNGVLMFHSQYAKPNTKDELLEIAKKYYMENDR